ncbi:MAG: hypothetical protein ACLFPF_10665 [Halanaerobiales bacterium]
MRKYHLKKLNSKPYYQAEPWTITEDNFQVENNHHNETIFSIGNGYMGVRGTLEEDYSGPEGSTTPGIYINGVYASEKILYDEEPPQQPQKTQTIISLADWTKINLYLDGEKFDLLKGTVEGYRRTLNMKEGKLERSLIWTSPAGKKAYIQITRLLSFTDYHIGVIKYSVKPLNFSGSIKIISEVEGNVRNYYHLRDKKALKTIDKKIQKDGGFLLQKVNTTDFNIAISMVHKLDCSSEILEMDSITGEERIAHELTVDLAENQGITLYKYVSFFTSLDCELENNPQECVERPAEKELSKKAFSAARNSQSAINLTL